MATYAHRTTRVCRVLVGLAVLWGIMGLSGGGSWASDSETSRATLRGLEGVCVLIEDLTPEIEQAGLTKSQLQTDVELRLRQAGIPVLPQKEGGRMTTSPCLYVGVGLWQIPSVPAYGLMIEVKVLQWVSLVRDPSLTIGTRTWSIISLVERFVSS